MTVKVKGGFGSKWLSYFTNVLDPTLYIEKSICYIPPYVNIRPKDVSQVIFVCDRYSGYKKFARDCSYILLAFCWVHVRRDFLETARSRPEYEEWMFGWVNDIRELYTVLR